MAAIKEDIAPACCYLVVALEIWEGSRDDVGTFGGGSGLAGVLGATLGSEHVLGRAVSKI
jgi:hypothetical protein